MQIGQFKQVRKRQCLNALALALTLAMIMAVGVFADAHAVTSADDAGRLIFDGKTSITGRMAGHADTLPPQAIRCGNCHRLDRSQPQANSFAPILDASRLLEPISRRGGPASRFDSVSLCKLLRDGIDPAWIVLPTTMPRYELSDAQCTALWAFLVKPK